MEDLRQSSSIRARVSAPSLAESALVTEVGPEPALATAIQPRPSLPLLRLLIVALSLVAVLLLWTLAARASSPDILPGPDRVWNRFLQALRDGVYVSALLTTLQEAAFGWLLAAFVALPLGYLIGRLRTLEDALAPYLAGSMAMPIVAIAPLLVVWLGFGLLPKVVVCALIAFFPMLATTAGGIRGVAADFRDTARVFGASPLQMAMWVDVPLAARTIFAGIKVAAALAVTGAVVGEFVASDDGLGYLINYGRQIYDVPLVFVGLISLIALGALAYTAVTLVERVTVRWEE